MKLLEPIFIIGKRIDDIKGYYFTLLDDAEVKLLSLLYAVLLISAMFTGSECGPDSRRFACKEKS